MTNRIAWGAVLLLAFLLACYMAGLRGAWSQEHHQHHNVYQNWSSLKTSNCCNNDDCGTLDLTDVRETKSGTEVRVGVEWCPVLREHFIIRGRSPDWTVPHACINKKPYASFTSVCDRLLCFAGTGGI